ncbi:hypothetical protein AcW1_005985 [Taiwanofungus camphoratus]|nr:hypothetical protein AcW2_004738 [Antrodia cinnamomea]KAI0934472.1 hypothetical protein AcV5_006303 [Antrodia cinnamomea]KAI0950237.1 hypothetical protein AcV7_008771 [Antrodia cinnamomea]KAI0957672.1 hypothetical protein AcW1_005985 [Antrodia cinnamomea]
MPSTNHLRRRKLNEDTCLIVLLCLIVFFACGKKLSCKGIEQALSSKSGVFLMSALIYCMSILWASIALLVPSLRLTGHGYVTANYTVSGQIAEQSTQVCISPFSCSQAA